ncbi:MAG TPA: hypothetical protein VMT66_00515 [Steroidobacteraceae bacterium]|nr:hypothetical protein [Steroidobacteraceae bacterium]
MSCAAALAASLLAIHASSASAQAIAAWAPNDITVAQSVAGQAGTASSRFEVARNGDARITIDRRDGGEHLTGTILLIGGRWMLSRGFAAAPDRELESLDLATLNSQLVIVLLTAALPKGAPPAGAPQHVRIAEKTRPIRIATASTSAEYAAPWTVVGTVSVPGAEPTASYQLSFTYEEQGLARTVDYTGSVGTSKAPPEFADSMKLHGWKVRRLPQSLESSLAAATPAAPAGSGAATVATLGELRTLD